MLRRILGRTVSTSALALGFALLAAPPANADTMFLKIDGIKGEATAKEYVDQIEIMSWSWGVTNSSTAAVGGGAGAGKAAISDLNLMKVADSATPKLFQAAAAGKHLPKAVLTMRRGSDGEAYFKITLEDVVVTALQLSAGGERPAESLSLSFGKVLLEYKPAAAPGKPTEWMPAGWDVQKNIAPR